MDDSKILEKMPTKVLVEMCEKLAIFNNNSNVAVVTKGGINDLIRVFIISDEFGSFKYEDKNEIIKNLDYLRWIIEEIEQFCIDNSLGDYNHTT